MKRSRRKAESKRTIDELVDEIWDRIEEAYRYIDREGKRYSQRVIVRGPKPKTLPGNELKAGTHETMRILEQVKAYNRGLHSHRRSKRR